MMSKTSTEYIQKSFDEIFFWMKPKIMQPK